MVDVRSVMLERQWGQGGHSPRKFGKSTNFERVSQRIWWKSQKKWNASNIKIFKFTFSLAFFRGGEGVIWGNFTMEKEWPPCERAIHLLCKDALAISNTPLMKLHAIFRTVTPTSYMEFYVEIGFREHLKANFDSQWSITREFLSKVRWKLSPSPPAAPLRN